MSKELTPLEAFTQLICKISVSTMKTNHEELHIIETALKDYEELKIVAKPLTDEEKKSINNVAKRLKALEIIKEKGLNVDYFQRSCDEEYKESIFCIERLLTQEQFDLLKEVLK